MMWNGGRFMAFSEGLGRSQWRWRCQRWCYSAASENFCSNFLNVL